MSSHPQSESLRSLLRKTLPFVRPDAGRILVVLALAGTGAALSALEPLALKAIIDTLATPTALKKLGVEALLLLGLLLAREGVGAFLDWLTWRIRIDVDYRLLSATIDRLHALPIAFHRKQ